MSIEGGKKYKREFVVDSAGTAEELNLEQEAESKFLESLADNFKHHLERGGQAEGVLRIESNGTMAIEVPVEEGLRLAKIRSEEEFYDLMHRIEQLNQQFQFSFEKDPEGKWVKYKIKNKK